MTATGLVVPTAGSSAVRAAEAVTDGAVASYFSGQVDAALTLPALSRHVPETEAPPSPVRCTKPVLHDAIPDVASEPLNENVTGLLNQPFASAARLGVDSGHARSVRVDLELQVKRNASPVPSVAVQSSESLFV